MKSKFDILFEEVQNFIINPVDEDLIEEEEIETVCKICDKPFPTGGSAFKSIFNFYFSGNEEKNVSPICYNCAKKIALENLDAIRSGEAELTEVSDRNWYILRWTTCDSCERLYPENELKCTNVGKLCEYCIDDEISDGKKISFDCDCDVIG